MTHHLRFVAAVAVLVALASAGCGGSPSSASAQPQLIEGTLTLPPDEADVVNFTATRAGTLSASVDWTAPGEVDVDIYLLKANCSLEDLYAEVAGCRESDVVASDEGVVRPAVFSTAVTTGQYTFVLFNNDSVSASATYRLEIT
jgi:hypothetical protein